MRGLLESIRYNSTDKRLEEMDKKTDELNSLQNKLKKIEGHTGAVTDIAIIFFSVAMLLHGYRLYQKGVIGFDGMIVSTVSMMSSFGPVAALSGLAAILPTLSRRAKEFSAYSMRPQWLKKTQTEKQLLSTAWKTKMSDLLTAMKNS